MPMPMPPPTAPLITFSVAVYRGEYGRERNAGA